jgi:glycine dehydrogenase subunit 1
MLARIGAESVDDLFANVPEGLQSGPPPIPEGMSEMEVLRLLNGLAAENVALDIRPSFLGAGAYRHYIPAAVGAIVGRSEFYTSYTPYQPEISQGTLQAIYEYQTMIAELTGLDISNASLYDAATGVTEATTIVINESRRDRVVLAGGVHPEYRRVAETYLEAQGFGLTVVGDGWTLDPGLLVRAIDDTVAGVVVQSPNFWGAIEPMAELAQATHAAGAQFVAVVNPLSLAVLASPGEYGADVAVGCGQPFGIPLSYGGPYLGFMAVRAGLERRLPGRIAGATVDGQGRKGYVLTLQAREQHIRREKATSNICTNHALMALSATVYLSLLGPEGLRATALQCVQKAHYAAQQIAAISGFTPFYDLPFFNEFVVRTPVPAAEVNRFLLGRDIIGGLDLAPYGEPNGLLLAFTEVTTRSDIDDLVATLGELVPARTPERSAVQVGSGS